jgi:hypothetical protein
MRPGVQDETDALGLQDSSLALGMQGNACPVISLAVLGCTECQRECLCRCCPPMVACMSPPLPAGGWAAATAAFGRAYHLTTYGERKRWLLLLLWPLLLLFSRDFRQQFWAAVRGRRPGRAGADGPGSAEGEGGAAAAAH